MNAITRVIKIGGNEMNTPGFLDELARQIGELSAASGDALVIVHGGGQEIATLQSRLGIEPIKIDGLRVEYDDGFGLARPSNTTPVVVLRFEADTEAAIERIKGEFRREIAAVAPGVALPF